MISSNIQNSKHYLEHEGVKRAFQVHVPPDYDVTKPVPLVLIFHGSDMTASGMQRVCKMDVQADAHGFITVYPEGLDKSWNDGRGIAERQNRDDIGFVDKLIEVLSNQLAIDSRRIYAGGLSNGGFFCQYLAGRLPNKIAAVASVAASVPVDADWDSKTVVPIIFFLGDRDPVVPYQGGKVRVLLRGDRGAVKSAADSFDYWVRRNFCHSYPTGEFAEGTAAEGFFCKEYSSVESDSCVVCYTVRGGGHTWPGGRQFLPSLLVGNTVKSLAASEIIWGFFAAHPGTAATGQEVPEL